MEGVKVFRVIICDDDSSVSVQRAGKIIVTAKGGTVEKNLEEALKSLTRHKVVGFIPVREGNVLMVTEDTGVQF